MHSPQTSRSSPLRTFLAVALLTLPTLSLAACSIFTGKNVAEDPVVKADSIHSVGFDTLEGKHASFADYTGKVVLVVNVASECGYTPQYAGLEKLYRELAPKGLVVIGFPSNEFGGQEPGDAGAIRTFCQTQFDVTFPLAAKIETKEGPTQSPVYGFLGKSTGKLPGWNFSKYLVAKDGKVLGFYPSKVAPEDAELRKAIEAALAAS